MSPTYTCRGTGRGRAGKRVKGLGATHAYARGNLRIR
jgi:hypothetical protein